LKAIFEHWPGRRGHVNQLLIRVAIIAKKIEGKGSWPARA
jgi:hypothetical protein